LTCFVIMIYRKAAPICFALIANQTFPILPAKHLFIFLIRESVFAL